MSLGDDEASFKPIPSPMNAMRDAVADRDEPAVFAARQRLYCRAVRDRGVTVIVRRISGGSSCCAARAMDGKHVVDRAVAGRGDAQPLAAAHHVATEPLYFEAAATVQVAMHG